MRAPETAIATFVDVHTRPLVRVLKLVAGSALANGAQFPSICADVVAAPVVNFTWVGSQAGLAVGVQGHAFGAGAAAGSRQVLAPVGTSIVVCFLIGYAHQVVFEVELSFAIELGLSISQTSCLMSRIG